MGRQERVLTLDGEYVHLDGAERKGMFDRGKSAVHYLSPFISILTFVDVLGVLSYEGCIVLHSAKSNFKYIQIHCSKS